MTGDSAFLAACTLTAVATAALLVAEYRESRTGAWIAKPLAALGFLWAAVAAGALESLYGKWVLAALVLSFGGDVLLIPKARASFLAGLVSFLLGHLAYAGAFAVRGLSPEHVALAAIAVLPIAWLAWRWLQPHVESGMRGPVLAYVGVISVMVLFAFGTFGAAGNPAIAVGAVSFYVSDLAVARQRFVAQTFWNKTWGLPLYFGGQLILASTVG